MEYDYITFDDFGIMLDEVAELLPSEIFVNLNGGINLLPETKLHPESTAVCLYILGEYHSGGNLGRYINIYYGSFMELYGRSSLKNLRVQLDKVLRHEFLHHLESMAGEKELEIKDKIDLERYKIRWS
jgi:hypothetical protein